MQRFKKEYTNEEKEIVVEEVKELRKEWEEALKNW